MHSKEVAGHRLGMTHSRVVGRSKATSSSLVTRRNRVIRLAQDIRHSNMPMGRPAGNATLSSTHRMVRIVTYARWAGPSRSEPRALVRLVTDLDPRHMAT